jgi:hypothetical protein
MRRSQDARRHAREKGLAVFTDLRLLARALLAGRPPAAALRDAQYVVVDHRPVPLGHGLEGLELARTEGGVGATSRPPPRATLELPSLQAPPPPRPLTVRVEVRTGRGPGA